MTNPVRALNALELQGLRDIEEVQKINVWKAEREADRLLALLADLLALGVGGIGGTVTQSDIDDSINSAIENLVSTAPVTLNTLVELAAALNNDANFAATITNALSFRLRFDAVQSLTSVQKIQAHANLGTFEATVNSQTGTAYTLGTVTTDNDGKTYLRMTNAAANTVTIPSTQTKPISITCRGAGLTTLLAGAGVTLNGDLVFTAQHQTKTVIPLGGNVFDVVG